MTGVSLLMCRISAGRAALYSGSIVLRRDVCFFIVFFNFIARTAGNFPTCERDRVYRRDEARKVSIDLRACKSPSDPTRRAFSPWLMKYRVKWGKLDTLAARVV